MLKSVNLSDRILVPAAGLMARNTQLGNLAVKTSNFTGGLMRGIGWRGYNTGETLQRTALREGFSSYENLMSSNLQSNSAVLPAGYLEKGWIIANHKLVSFHAAFLTSLLNLPADVHGKLDTLKFMFASAETAISGAMLYAAWHIGIAVHEMGHYVTAAKLTALNDASQLAADNMKNKGFLSKIGWYSSMFVKIPWGKFEGVKNEGGNYFPDAPYNLAVAAAGPRWSRNLAITCLPISALLIGGGLATGNEAATYAGRALFAPGVIGMLDYFLADSGKLKEFNEREKAARDASLRTTKSAAQGSWQEQSGSVKKMLINSRPYTIKLPDGTEVSAPWQWRNCAMGGRHTLKQYPESNISLQESMFMPLSAKTYEDAQAMTVKLQNRLKEIIEIAPRARVMGIGLEGGLAPYIEKDPGDQVPEQRLWRMMKQAIFDCDLKPGVDVAIALDPAASELENAYREEKKVPSSIGMYLFWRDKGQVEMSREDMLDLYRTAIERDGIPLLSIEDGFGEKDHAGWQLGMRELGEGNFIIGDDLITTRDSAIEACAFHGEIDAALIKANQIGTLTETTLAMLTAIAFGDELVISHRSQSPNDPFEADIAVGIGAVGLKAGGGANTERLQKYGRVMEIMAMAKSKSTELTSTERAEVEESLKELIFTLTGRGDIELVSNAADINLERLFFRLMSIDAIVGNEEATNSGIPSAAATVMIGRTGIIRFKGSTPLGTSAGEAEAIHLVDSMVWPSDITKRYPELFKSTDDGTMRFNKGLKKPDIEEKNDQKLSALWERTERYEGKGCMNAVENIEGILAQRFTGKKLSALNSLLDVDAELLAMEREQSIAFGRLNDASTQDDQINAMQRKGFLGMNSILSMSVALGRAVAARDGKELWQLVREQASGAMIEFILNETAHDKNMRRAALEAMSFDDLKKAYREITKKIIEDNTQKPAEERRKIYEGLRVVLPVYSSASR